METTKGASAILEWRMRFLEEGAFEECTYHQALLAAQRLQLSGLIDLAEWIELVRLANTALLRAQR